MKNVNVDCIRQDKYLLSNQGFCSMMYPKAKSYGQMVDLIAELFLNMLVHDGDPKELTFAVGRALDFHQKEYYLIAEDDDYLYKFHQQLREDVARLVYKKMKCQENGHNG